MRAITYDSQDSVHGWELGLTKCWFKYNPFTFRLFPGLDVPLLGLLLEPGLHSILGGIEDQRSLEPFGSVGDFGYTCHLPVGSP